MYFLIAFFGIVFHLAMKYRDSYTKKEVFDYKRQLIFSGFSLLTAFVIVYFKDGIVELASLDLDFTKPSAKVLMFLVAYFSDSVWKNIENTGLAKLKITDINPET